jgi:hypothetical protein
MCSKVKRSPYPAALVILEDPEPSEGVEGPRLLLGILLMERAQHQLHRPNLPASIHSARSAGASVHCGRRAQ